MKPKLSIFIYSLAGGGAERVASILINELHERYDITLVLMRDKIDYDIPGINIEFIENSKPFESFFVKFLKLPYLALKYKQFCKLNKIDISLVFMIRPCFVSLLSKIIGNTTPLIISERTTPSSIYADSSLKSKINKFLIERLYNKADKIITNSTGNYYDLINRFNVNQEKTTTIHNLFDIETINQLSKEMVAGIDFNKFTFVTVGRLDSGKNHCLMIDAIASIDNDKIQLLIIGDGLFEEKLKSKIQSLGLQNQVKMIGFDNNPYKYMAKADCFVFSSLYEGFPNVLLEALACGLPVISTDCQCGPREILAPDTDISFQLQHGIEKAEYGVLTTVGDKDSLAMAMNLIIDEHELREEYSAKSRLRATDFAKEKIIDTWMETIDGVIDRH